MLEGSDEPEQNLGGGHGNRASTTLTTTSAFAERNLLFNERSKTNKKSRTEADRELWSRIRCLPKLLGRKADTENQRTQAQAQEKEVTHPKFHGNPSIPKDHITP